MTRIRSAVKNRVHAILARHGVPREHSDLFGNGGREFLATLELRDAPRRRLDSLIALICEFDREIEQPTQEIEQRAQADDRVDVLCQIRGVGRYTAMLIVAEIGDVNRFPTARHLCSWAGLTPTVRSSDGNARLGRISRQGSPALRWALVEAAHKITTGSGRSREKFERIAKRVGLGPGSARWPRVQATLGIDRRENPPRSALTSQLTAPTRRPIVFGPHHVFTPSHPSVGTARKEEGENPRAFRRDRDEATGPVG